MDEKTVVEVFRHYLYKRFGVWLDPRPSGPDFLYKGKAWEVKGSKFDFNKMIEQLVRYGLEYSEITIVLPVDAFNMAKFLGLYLLADRFYQITGKFLGVCLITRDSEGRFLIRDFYNGSDVLIALRVCMERYIQDMLHQRGGVSMIADICADVFGRSADDYLRVLLHKVVCIKPDYVVEL
mgnify:CR=1 FL=1